MMDGHNNAEAALNGGTNGSSAPGDALYALSDEQILDIEPEPGREVAAGQPPVTSGQRTAAGEERAAQGPSTSVRASASPADLSVEGEKAAELTPRAPEGTEDDRGLKPAASQLSTQLQTEAATRSAAQPPQWLADMIADPQKGGEARAFWEQTREASAHARQLEELDRAYFAGDAASRTRLAETLLREDPAAFREMVFAGLKALAATETQRHGEGKLPAAASTATEQRDSSTPSRSATGTPLPSAPLRAGGMTEQTIAAYQVFERAANEDLERNVGTEIGRVLEQALPNASTYSVGDNAPVRERLAGAIRQEIEIALRGDRNLGDQVAQVLSARQFDGGTRAQVVRLIGERARQILPVAAKRVLNEWTRDAFAAHRSRVQKADAAASRRDVEGVSAVPENAARRARGSREIDYRRLTDQQILEL